MKFQNEKLPLHACFTLLSICRKCGNYLYVVIHLIVPEDLSETDDSLSSLFSWINTVQRIPEIFKTACFKNVGVLPA